VTIASDLVHRHSQLLVEDNEQWQTLIADDPVWELPYAPGIGHPARLPGREAVVRHVTWFIGAVENFRFFDLEVYPLAGAPAALAEVKAEGLIKPTGAPTVRTLSSSSALRVARSRSCANLSIPWVLPRHWIRRFLVSNETRRTGPLPTLAIEPRPPGWL
jgi:hypothetical protein